VHYSSSTTPDDFSYLPTTGVGIASLGLVPLIRPTIRFDYQYMGEYAVPRGVLGVSYRNVLRPQPHPASEPHSEERPPALARYRWSPGLACRGRQVWRHGGRQHRLAAGVTWASAVTVQAQETLPRSPSFSLGAAAG
jgi:hypothetical protein